MFSAAGSIIRFIIQVNEAAVALFDRGADERKGHTARDTA